MNDINQIVAQIDNMRADVTPGEWEACATKTDDGPIPAVETHCGCLDNFNECDMRPGCLCER